MTVRGTRRSRLYERALRRAVARVEHLLDPEEEVETAAIVQRGVKPLYSLITMSLGAGLVVPGLTSPDALVPDAVRWYVGGALFVAGSLSWSVPGQALLLLTPGTAYVVSRPPLPWLQPRLLGDVPASAFDLDLERGCATVAGQRLWALPGQASSLRALARGEPAGPGVAPPERDTRAGAFRRVGAILVAVLGILVATGLILDAAIETDPEAIERVLTDYNDDLVHGNGEEACAALTARARRELVEESTVILESPDGPPTCEKGVEMTADRLSEADRRLVTGREIDVEVEVDGDRTYARVGAPFAYGRIPLRRTDGDWKLATNRPAWVVRDAPADDPPTPGDFALRVAGACQNSKRRFVPAGARLAAIPDPATNPEAAEPFVRQLREISEANRALARDLSSLTPPAGRRADVLRVAGALLRLARARDGVGQTLIAEGSRAVEERPSRLSPAQRSYGAAVRAAGLERALGNCL